MPSVMLVLLSFGFGVLIVSGRSNPRGELNVAPMTPRERAIAAQKISAQASQLARELAMKWSAEEDSRALKERQ